MHTQCLGGEGGDWSGDWGSHCVKNVRGGGVLDVCLCEEGDKSVGIEKGEGMRR